MSSQLAIQYHQSSLKYIQATLNQRSRLCLYIYNYIFIHFTCTYTYLCVTKAIKEKQVMDLSGRKEGHWSFGRKEIERRKEMIWLYFNSFKNPKQRQSCIIMPDFLCRCWDPNSHPYTYISTLPTGMSPLTLNSILHFQGLIYIVFLKALLPPHKKTLFIASSISAFCFWKKKLPPLW